MKVHVYEVFQAGRWTKARTEARQVAAPHTNFLVNHRDPGDEAPGGAGEHAHPTVEVNDGIMRLGTLMRTKQLSRELMLHAASFVRRIAQRATRSSTDPMRASYLVDSGASRDGLPKRYFPPPGTGGSSGACDLCEHLQRDREDHHSEASDATPCIASPYFRQTKKNKQHNCVDTTNEK